MQRAVIDTNVFVSGLLSPGAACGQLLDLLFDGAFEAVADSQILDEYESVLGRRELALPPAEVEALLRFLRLEADIVAPRPLPVELPDPDDRPFLETAAATAARLVTGNKRHFPAGVRSSVAVLSPREFLALLAREP